MIESNSSYRRSFIILDESNSTYRSDSKKVSTGFVKMEQKGKKVSLCVYVQNIISGTYDIWGICKEQKEIKLTKLGSIVAEDAAKAEICFETSPEALCKAHNNINNFAGIVMVDKGANKIFEGFQREKLNYNFREAMKSYEDEQEALLTSAKAKTEQKAVKKVVPQTKSESQKNISPQMKSETAKNKMPEVKKEQSEIMQQPKKTMPEKKVEPVKQMEPERKMEPVKQMAPERKMEPVKQMAPEKKMEPIKQMEPERKMEPVKQMAPERKMEPVKQMAPEKKMEPIKQMEPERKMEPVKQMAPEKKMEPIKQMEPERKMEPVKQMEPEKKMEPIKQMEPERKMEPIKQMEPERKMEPIKQMEPERRMEPIKQMEPEKKMEPVKPMEPEKRMEPEIEIKVQPQPKIEMDIQLEIESVRENTYELNNYNIMPEEQRQEQMHMPEHKNHEHCKDKKEEKHEHSNGHCKDKCHHEERKNEDLCYNERDTQREKTERKSGVLNSLYGTKGKNEIVYLPFEQANRNIKWKKKSLVNISNSYVLRVMSIPYIYNMCSIYGHYVIGYGENNIIVGVPARYNDTYNYMRKYKDIAKWVKMSESLPSYGYWIFRIDKRTGEILYSA